MKQPASLILPSHREDRYAFIRALFPNAQGPDLTGVWQGGRQSALKRLSQVDAIAYSRTRNHLSGAVTHLSPYIRHGCLSLNEIIDDVLTRFGKSAVKLVSELTYHDYFRQVWYRYGDAIETELEHCKVIPGQAPLPAYIEQGITGLVCMDEIIRDLKQQGYVHNHARMWFAAYILHWLKVDWREAAEWFEAYLLDGNIASNHLSWQWVASSFSNKPYIFNKENIMKFGGEAWCKHCHVKCPFDDSYENLQTQLFPINLAMPEQPVLNSTAPVPSMTNRCERPEVVWVHDEMLSPAHPLLASDLPAIFIYDPEHYRHWPLKRLQFMADCLAEMPNVAIWAGNTRQVLTYLGYNSITTQRTPQTRLKKLAHTLEIQWQPEPSLHTITCSDTQLMRFSRYWKKVGPSIMGDFYQD